MLLLLQFHAGSERYGLDISHVIEVAPLVMLRKIPHAADYVAGLFNYRGALVPVIDLTVRLTGVPSRRLMSTRIILVKYCGVAGASHILGLLAEGVTETVVCRPSDLQSPVISVTDAPYLGSILIEDRRSLQCIETDKLLPADMRTLLFPQIEAGP
jgi:chemotaxis-related protein WspB